MKAKTMRFQTSQKLLNYLTDLATHSTATRLLADHLASWHTEQGRLSQADYSRYHYTCMHTSLAV